MSGSIFDKGVPWNLSELQTTLSEGLKGMDVKGVTTPYVYVGSWKSMFGWHKEDLDLYSINYLHYGRPKFWYSVDLDCNQTFENYARSQYPEQFKNCSEYLRHKTTLIHPKNLLREGIRMRKIVHHPREFVISRASGYHSGFNSGFNVAEAVNFALPTWIPIAEKAGHCNCTRDSVKINMDIFKRVLAGEDIESI